MNQAALFSLCFAHSLSISWPCRFVFSPILQFFLAARFDSQFSRRSCAGWCCCCCLNSALVGVYESMYKFGLIALVLWAQLVKSVKFSYMHIAKFQREKTTIRAGPKKRYRLAARIQMHREHLSRGPDPNFPTPILFITLSSSLSLCRPKPKLFLPTCCFRGDVIEGSR